MDSKNFQEKTYVRPEPKGLKWHRRPWDNLFFILMYFLAIAIPCICNYMLKLNIYTSGIVGALVVVPPPYLHYKHLRSTMLRCIDDFRIAEGFSDENYKVTARRNGKNRQIIFTVKPK